MGPIQPKKPISTPATTPATGPAAPGQTSAEFSVGPVGIGATPGVSPAAAVSNSSLPALRTHIQAAMQQSTNPDAIVKTVVERRIDEQFGKLATPQMKASVVDQLSADPHFVSTIHRLIREVSASK